MSLGAYANCLQISLIPFSFNFTVVCASIIDNQSKRLKHNTFH